MATIKAINQGIQKLNLKEAIVNTVKAKAEIIADLQAIQLSKGQTKKGGEFPDYSQRSIEEFGKPPGPWRVKDTGSLYAGLFLKKIDPTGWEISSRSETLQPFLKTYARKEFGGSKDGTVSGDKIEKARQYTFGLNKETRRGGAENEPFVTGIFLNGLKEQLQIQSGLKF